MTRRLNQADVFIAKTDVNRMYSHRNHELTKFKTQG